MMDLTKLDVVELANAGTVLELTYPMSVKDSETGEEFEKGDPILDEKGKPWSIGLLGSDSDEFRSGNKKRLEIKFDKKGKVKKTDSETEELKLIELMAKCVTSVHIVEDGKPIKFSRDEMVRVFRKYPWVREQAEEHMADRSALTMS